MSGLPAFQGNAFQANAFQAGANIVAGDYVLGALAIDKPAARVTYTISVNRYDLAALAIDKPAATQASNVLHVNPYTLGALSWPTIYVRSFQYLRANNFYTAALDFASPAILTQTQNLQVNRFDVEPLAWSPVAYRHSFSFSSADFDVGALIWAPPTPPFQVGFVFGRADFALGSPFFAWPRIIATVPAHVYYPPSYLAQVEQATTLLQGVCDKLMASLPNVVNPATNTARAALYDLRSNADTYIRGTTLGSELTTVYTAVDAAGASYAGLDACLQFIFSQIGGGTPAPLTAMVINATLFNTLAAECNAITRLTFTNRDQAQAMLLHVQTIFESAMQIALMSDDPGIYESIIALGGSTANFLANTAMQLPTWIGFNARAAFPSLYLAQRIYQDPSRYAEIEAENGVVHPAFCPINLRVLSND